MVNRLSRIVFSLTTISILAPAFLLPWIMCVTLVIKIGPWYFGQTVFLVLIFLCAILALGLAAHACVSWETKFQVKSNYLAWAAWSFAAWSSICSYYAHVPWLAWTGAPEIGVGILWYIALGVMIVGYCTLEHTKYHKALLINLIIAAGIVSYLCFVGDMRHGLIPDFKWKLYHYKEHIIFIGMALLGVGVVLDNKNYQKTCLILGTLIVFGSTNRFGIGGFVLSGLLTLVAYYLYRRGQITDLHLRIIFVLAVIFVPCYGYYMAPHMSSEFVFTSIYTRYNYWRACIGALLMQPFRLIVGYGWGSFTDTMLAGIHKIPVTALFGTPFSELFLRPHPQHTWAEVGLDASNLINGELGYHSHNQFIESLLSAGIIGAILFTLLLVLPVIFCRKSKIIGVGFCVVALSILFCGWYELPGTLPYLAVFGALVVPETRFLQERTKNVLKFLLPSLGVILLLFSVTLTYIDMRFDQVAARVSNIKTILGVSGQEYMESAGPGGIYYSLLLQSFWPTVKSGKLDQKDIIMLDRFLSIANLIPSPSLFLLAFELPLFDFIANNTQDPRLNNQKIRIIDGGLWENRIAVLLSKWYTRADLVLPYFNWLVKHNYEACAKAVLQNMLKIYGPNQILEDYLQKLESQTPVTTTK